MKIKSVKSIYLSKRELKEAIVYWLFKNGKDKLANHLKGYPCEFDWSHEDDGVHLAVDMDGQFEENGE